MSGRVCAFLTMVIWVSPTAVRADPIDDLVASLRPSPVNYATWARNLLKAAGGLGGKPPAKARLYEKAYEFGVKGPKGYATAIQAASAIIEAGPNSKVLWQKKLLTACKLDWQAADRTREKEAGRVYVAQVIAVGDDALASGSPAEAARLYKEASYKVRNAPSRKDEIVLKLRDAGERQRLQSDLDRCRKALEANPKSVPVREKLIRMYLVDFDDPTEAAKAVTPDIAENLRTYVPLAAREMGEVDKTACLELGDWYQVLAGQATLRGKLSALARAQGYYERFLALEKDPLKAAVGQAKLAKVNSWRPPLPIELKHGLILHYDFGRDEPKAGVKDISGRKNHGERNAARWTESGRKGGGCEVDGTGYVSVPSTAKMRLAGQLTISAWVNVREFKRDRRGRSEFMGSRLDGIEGRGEFVWEFKGGKMSYMYWSGDGDVEFTKSVPGPSTGRWYHVALVVSSSTDSVALYRNGSLSGRDDRFAKDFTPSKSQIRIGKVWFGAPAGTFDEVMIYNRALSAHEINRIYILQGGRR